MRLETLGILFVGAWGQDHEKGLIPNSMFTDDTGAVARYAPELYESNQTYEGIVYDDLLARTPIRISRYAELPEEIIVYCYPFTEEEITDKCFKSLNDEKASSLFLPMMNEVQMQRTDTYYEKIRELKEMDLESGKKIKVYGVSYDNPKWDVVDRITSKFPGLFDGMLIEWIGDNACIWNIREPSTYQLERIQNNAGIIMYFYRQQACEVELLAEATKSAYYNPNAEISIRNPTVERGVFPSFILPVFACFAGEEGPCYQAHKFYRENACNDNQLYAWSPYDQLGGLMMYYRNDSCVGLQNHVLYSVV